MESIFTLCEANRIYILRTFVCLSSFVKAKVPVSLFEDA